MKTELDPIDPDVNPDQLVADLMGDPSLAEPPAPIASAPDPTSPVPPTPPATEPPAPTTGTDNVALPGDEVFAQLDRARADHQSTATNLHAERQKNTGLEAQVAHLTAQMQGFVAGTNQVAPPAAPAPGPVAQIDDAALDAFMVNIDPDWAENRTDPHLKASARYSLMISSEGIKYSQAAINRVNAAQVNMAFDQKLAGLGITKPQFEAVWNRPGYEWGATLDDHQKLAALETQVAQMSGSRPANQPGLPPGHGGAPTTSRVAQNRTIETDQGSSGAAHNPTRLSQLKVAEALDSGDPKQVAAAGDVLFDNFFAGLPG